MTTEYFDYENFALSMKEQATDLLPDDINDENKNYIKETIYNFVFLSGEALCDDETIDFSSDDGIFTCQVIAEWTFHKSVDLAHSAVPKEYWDSVLQNIAYTIFEVVKLGIKRNINEVDLLSAVEHHVNKAWKESLEELSENNIIPNSVAEITKGLSNIDDMAEKTELGTIFRLNPVQVQDLIETTAMTLMRAHNHIGQQPVILCSPRLRLPLYQLLERHIPTIVVISYSELIPDIKVEAVDTISNNTD